MKRYAVMGNPIAHSLSPVIHHWFAEQTGCELSYEKILIDLPRFEQQVDAFFQQGGSGLNITLPCKQRAFAMSEHASARCRQAGAANTLWLEKGCLHADNTDGIGLLRDLKRYVNLDGKTILLLGAGGAARGILGPLLSMNPRELTITNRTAERAHALRVGFPKAKSLALSELSQLVENHPFDVIINATATGLDDNMIDLPDAIMVAKPFCYDLAYRKQGPTPFVAWAQSLGGVAVDGLGMLVEQAAEAFFIWHGMMPDVEPVLASIYAKNA